MPYYPEFAELLTAYLREQDRSASWLAERLAVEPSTVSRWLEGATRPRNPEVVVKIADCLGVFDAAARTALLSAAGYAATVTPVASAAADDASKPIARWLGRTAAALPAWLAAPLLQQPGVYAALPWTVEGEFVSQGCGEQGLDLSQQRLTLSGAFGAYFAGLLERDRIYVELAGQVRAPAPSSLAHLPPLERMAWALNHPRGPRAIVIAAEGGMGKSTLAAQLLRCLLAQHDFDWLLGDSAKQARVDVVSGTVYPLQPGFWSVDTCFAQLRSQLGLPPSNSASTRDIADRLIGRRTLILIDNMESVAEHDDLLRRLGPLLSRDVRAVITTRTAASLRAFTQRAMVVHLQPIVAVDALGEFLRWHVEQYSAIQPFVRVTALPDMNRAQQVELLARTGGIPLLVQLVYTSIARLSWSYLEALPRLYGSELLNFLYTERWQELAAAGPAGACAQDLLLAVAKAQIQGERVNAGYLQQWATHRHALALLPPALDLLSERFLLINSDLDAGDFSLFPSLVEFVLDAQTG